MFSPKRLFLEVPCPHLQHCNLPNCIFQHPAEGQANAVKSESVTNNSENHVDLKFGDDDNGQRKRRKVEIEKSESEGQDGSVPATVRPRKEPTSKPSAVKLPSSNTAKRSSIDREISPPPLRLKLQEKAIPVKQSSPPQTGYTKPVSTPSKSKVETKTPVKVPEKREALNPRTLKKGAPASHDMRFRLLRALHDQFVRLNSELKKDANDEEEALVCSDQELITKALDIEENATAVASIYSNVVKNNILAYKRMTVAQWKDERLKDTAQQKASQVASMEDSPFTKSLGSPKVIETGLSRDEELTLLSRLYTPTEGLSKHGYINSVPTEEDVAQAVQGIEAAKGWEVCDRCKCRFQVFPDRREEDGALSSGGPCTYHFGKPFWQERLATDPKAKREKKYRCCGQAMGDSPGCTKSDSHVFKISEVKRLAAVLNFIHTPPNPNAHPEKPVCIDGEMGYTVYGLELIRLTATSWPGGEELLDVLVRPVGNILDLNSRYSGVWPKDMAEALPWEASPDTSKSTADNADRKLRIVSSPSAARALLLTHLAPQTPIIGHGLENDLNAVRLIHPTLIDTALLFPHKAGLPYRNGLKMLMQTHLNRQIQVTSNVNGKIVGHDSKEDANAAGDLVRFAVSNEWAKMKREGWKLMGGAFLPPTPKDVPSFHFDSDGVLTGPKAARLTVEELERNPTVLPPRKRGLSGKKVGEKRSSEEMAVRELEGELNY